MKEPARSTAICTSESVYSQALTRGAEHRVVAHDEGRRQIRLQGGHGRLGWFPACCSDVTGAEDVILLVEITVDDEIRDPNSDWIEVTIESSDGSRGWSAFTRPDHLLRHGDRHEAEHGTEYRLSYGNQVLVVDHLAPEVMRSAFASLDRQ